MPFNSVHVERSSALARQREAEARQRQREHEAEQIRRRHELELTVAAASNFCKPQVKLGLGSTVEDVAQRASDDAWRVLNRKWKRSRCKWLEQLAQSILGITSDLSYSAGKLSHRTLLHEPERIFAWQLLMNIPLPGDEQLVATAHGLRLIGVYLCTVQGVDLRHCPCFRSLAIEYTKEQVSEYLVSTGTRWMRGP